MIEFSVDGYKDVLRIEDDEEFPPCFLTWLQHQDEAMSYTADDMRHEIMQMDCE